MAQFTKANSITIVFKDSASTPTRMATTMRVSGGRTCATVKAPRSKPARSILAAGSKIKPTVLGFSLEGPAKS